MGSRLKRIRRSIPLAIPAVGSGWKEDLLALRHLASCLGFADVAIRAEVSASEKPGHFRPGIVIAQGELRHAFMLEDVPGTLAAAQAAWDAFRRSIPLEPDGVTYEKAAFLAMFRTSTVADPEVAQRLCEGLMAAGFRIPLTAPSLAPALHPTDA